MEKSLKMKEVPFIVMYVMENGPMLLKASVCLILAVLSSPIFALVIKICHYLFPDLGFVVWITIAITIDWVSGMAKHFIIGDFCRNYMILGLCIKVGVGFGALLLFTGASSTLADHPDIASYLILLGKIAIFMYVTISAFDNFFIITGGRFPPGWYMKRMKKFNKTGKLEDLIKGNN